MCVVYGCVTIRDTKIQYDQSFIKYKGDIKKTWQTISDIICKSNTQRKTLDKIIVDSRVIKNKEEMYIKHNHFFICKNRPKVN